jgi:hypothetical protein
VCVCVCVCVLLGTGSRTLHMLGKLGKCSTPELYP